MKFKSDELLNRINPKYIINLVSFLFFFLVLNSKLYLHLSQVIDLKRKINYQSSRENFEKSHLISKHYLVNREKSQN